MYVPDYLLPRPPMPTDAATLGAFDRLFDEKIIHGTGGLVQYELAAPVWQFLCHSVDTREVLLHGSDNPDIEVFEPRRSIDVNPFGNRTAVFAASDGLWPMYFAILDRKRHDMTRINSSVRIEQDGVLSDPFYFFSITREALAARAFAPGTIYILPRQGFEHQAPFVDGDQMVHLPQWASLAPVVPLARIAVVPEDFPFLGAIRGHDDKSTFERAAANPRGFPWLE
jgi:hypothetical protein